MITYDKLADKYDFLTPGTVCEIPRGWLDITDHMASEIQEELDKAGIDDYVVMQVKEKYGALRWYDYGGNEQIDKIIRKYEDISEHTCCGCGRNATKMSMGWICPWCDDCAEEIGGSFREIKNDYN